MPWQPGQPVITATDTAERQAWKRARRIKGPLTASGVSAPFARARGTTRNPFTPWRERVSSLMQHDNRCPVRRHPYGHR